MENSTPQQPLDPRSLSPLYRSQTRKHVEASASSKNTKKMEAVKEIVKDGVCFPLDINGHSAVSHILSQKPGKLRAKDVREAIHKGIVLIKDL